jgi:tetratricopeptide (TPR) repeat protein
MNSAALLIAVLLAPAGIVEGATAAPAQSESLARKGATQVVIEVKDPSGAGIPNATIEYQRISETSSYKTSTDKYGRATLELDPGIYDVVVRKDGFFPLGTYFEVQEARSWLISLTLRVGSCPSGPCLPIFSPVPADRTQGLPFSLSISSPETVLEAGRDLRIEIRAGILRATPWQPDPNGDYAPEDYMVDVRDAHGKEPPQSRYLKHIRGTDTSLPQLIQLGTVVRPVGVMATRGMIFQSHLNLAALYDLSKPGKYTVQLWRLDEEGNKVESNTLRFKVVPGKAPLPFGPLAENPSSPPTISLEIWPGAPDTFSLDVVTKNESDRVVTLRGQGFAKDANGTLRLVRGNALGSIYKVDVRDDTGESPAETVLGKDNGIGDDRPPDLSRLPDASVPLKPGEEWHDTVDLRLLYDLGNNADYTIRVRRWDDDTHGWVISNAFTSTVSNGRTRLQVLFSRADQLLRQGRYSDAAPLFEQALPLATGKSLVEVEDCLADAYLGLHSYNKALSHYQRAIALDPSNGMHHLKLGNAYLQMRKFTEGVAELKKSAELDPADAESIEYNIGVIYYDNGQMDEAIHAFKTLTEKDPSFADAYAMFGFALVTKGGMVAGGKVIAPPGTVEALETYLKLRPSGNLAEQARSQLNAIKKTTTTTQN